MNLQSTMILLLFAIVSFTTASYSTFYEDEIPFSLRAFRTGLPTNRLDTFEPLLQQQQQQQQQRLLKRAAFNKRRGRELFGKRSLPIMDDEMAIYENRYRRRANELFG